MLLSSVYVRVWQTPVIHVLDASRSVTVVGALLSERKDDYVEVQYYWLIVRVYYNTVIPASGHSRAADYQIPGI